MRVTRYFVSYAHDRGFGRCEIAAQEPISTMEIIAAIERRIESGGARDVTILGFQPFPEPVEHDEGSRPGGD